jgi:hypothetical protein
MKNAKKKHEPIKQSIEFFKTLHNLSKFVLLLALIAVAVQFQSCGNSEETESSDTDTTLSSSESNSAVDTISTAPVVEGDLSASELDSFRMRRAFQIAANEFTMGYDKGDWDAFLAHLHPSITNSNGGSTNFKQRLKEIKLQDTFKYERIISGPVKSMMAMRDSKGNITGWYCLMPVRRWIKGRPETEFQLQWIAGQSLNNGKTVHFIDVTKVPKDKIAQIMPDLIPLLDRG